MADSQAIPKQPLLKIETVECSLCQLLFYEPVTTSCGHTFCRTCILRALDHNNKCPLCRTIITLSPETPINIVINEIIQQVFPAEYAERAAQHAQELRNLEFNMPLFVLDIVLFPNMDLPLHIYEPRYRLMLRRCLQGTRKFGVVWTNGRELAKVATVAEIQSYIGLPDGRSLISTRGGKRFKIGSTWEEDGYLVGRVEYFEDEPGNATNEHQLYTQALEILRQKAGQRELDVPSDPQAFSFWLGASLPISKSDRQCLLEMNSTTMRLERECSLLQSTQSGSAPCVLA